MKPVKIWRFLEFSISPKENNTDKKPKTAIEA
jgi:hypothetical protein